MDSVELNQLSDEALVDLCRERGDADDRPFSVLFQRHHPSIWRTCLYFLRNEHEAEDLVQEVFFRAYRGLSTYEGRASFKTWLTRIATNTCKNELRTRSRRPQVVEQELEGLDGSGALVFADATKAASDFSVETIAAAFELLRPDEVEVIQLRAIEGRSYAEVAQMLGISLSAAKMRVQRANLAMQKALGRA